MDGRAIRLQRLLGNGRAVIVAIDHGMFDGPIPAMEDLPATAAKINPLVDAVLLAPGMLRHCHELFAAPRRPLAAVRLNWNTVYCFHWNYREARSAAAYGVEDALREGMDMALVSLTLHTGSEERDAANVEVFCKLTAEAHRLGIPVIGEYFPTGHLDMSPQQLHEEVRIGSRIAAELGADLIKTFYTVDFAQVTAACPVPGVGAWRGEAAHAAGGAEAGGRRGPRRRRRRGLRAQRDPSGRPAGLSGRAVRRGPKQRRAGNRGDGSTSLLEARHGPTPLRPKIGLLALSLELYETLAPDLRPQREAWVRRQVLPALEQAGGRAVRRGRLLPARASRPRFPASRWPGPTPCWCCFWPIPPVRSPCRALKSTRLPIVIWNTQELFAVDEQYSMDALVANHGVHGTQDLANVLVRSGVKFHYVTSHLRDAEALDELVDFFAAAAARARLGRARFGMLGYPFPGMGDFAVDTTKLVASLGGEWTVVTIEDYIQRSEAAEAGAVGDAGRRVPPLVRSGRRRHAGRLGHHGPGRAGHARHDRRPSPGRADLPVHGLRRRPADADPSLRGRQPADGRGGGLRRRRRLGGHRRHNAFQLAKSAGEFYGNLHRGLWRQRRY